MLNSVKLSFFETPCIFQVDFIIGYGIFSFSGTGFGNENLFSIDSGSPTRTTLKGDENNF